MIDRTAVTSLRPIATMTAVIAAFASACGGVPSPPPMCAPSSPTTLGPAVATTSPSPATALPPSVVAAAPAASAAPRRPVDADAVAAATGGKPETTDDVVKVSFPREERVDIAGWNRVPAFMGLTSWAAFVRGEKPGVEAMVMGDFVLFEDEVNAAMSAALDGGLEVTALHNHFFFDKPRVFFMHIGGEGSIEHLGRAVKAMVGEQRAIRQKSATVATSFAGSSPGPGAGPSRIDATKLDAAFGVKGASKDGMYKAVMGRKAQAACGCTVGKTMGVNTWAAFGGSDESAVVDGDFAVSESELQAVLKSLRSGGINVVAIHSHMTGESPRILFLHYWGQGKAADLANILRRALDLTAWDGRAPQTHPG